MPQMAPLSWLILFIIFSLSFIIFNILNYYCFNKNFINNSKNETENNSLNNSLNWKW